jgi:transposase-like protein
MRLQVILPAVASRVEQTPTACRWCGSRRVHAWQTVAKPLRDTRLDQVEAERWHCQACGRTFRVYPQGVSARQSSQRLQGTAVMLYLLGLSYGAVALALTALGHPLAKTTVYYAVQSAAERVPKRRRSGAVSGVKTSGQTDRTATSPATPGIPAIPALGADLTSVRVKGQWLPLGVTVDDLSGAVLSIDALSGEDAATLEAWLTPIAEQVGAKVLVTDDADAFKQVADALGLPQQVCKAHVQRNTDALIAALRPLAERDADGSLAVLGLAGDQAVADLDALGALIRSRQPAEQADLFALYQRYAHAPCPPKGHSTTLAYRLRLLFLDRWNLWPRLTRYRRWRGPGGEQLNGTNNGCERGIGWWIKERYRPMRGYKREQSAVNVSRLLCWCGNSLATGAHLAEVLD